MKKKTLKSVLKQFHIDKKKLSFKVGLSIFYYVGYN